MVDGFDWGETLVDIVIFVEGGVLSSPNIDVLTMDNSTSLRQSLNRIFQEILNQNVQITVHLKSGKIAAYKQFASAFHESLVLFLDSDRPPSKMDSWFDDFEKEENKKREFRGESPDFHVPENHRKNMFFMIQEMESWILKDFPSIERWAKDHDLKRLRAGENMSQHSLVKKSNVEEIKKPSDKINRLFKIFFQKPNGEKVEYGKLKNAPALLDHIDVSILFNKDSELQRFAQAFKT